MKYKLIENPSGVPAGFVADGNGTLTLEQAQNFVLCGKENPTEADVTAAKQANQEYLASVEYVKNRRQEYPPIGDQLDALFKAGVFPADMAAAIQAVKDKYPKGTA